MSKKLGQKPAFATCTQLDGESYYQEGISKRFYAACAAMQGLLANPDVRRETSMSLIILESYQLADELLKQEDL